MRRTPFPIAPLVFAAACLAGIVAARADDDPFGPAKPPAGAAPAPAPVEPPSPPEALRPWLAHEDWLCRALAAKELERRDEDGVVALLSGALGREEDARVLAYLCRSLASARCGRWRRSRR